MVTVVCQWMKGSKRERKRMEKEKKEEEREKEKIRRGRKEGKRCQLTAFSVCPSSDRMKKKMKKKSRIDLLFE